MNLVNFILIIFLFGLNVVAMEEHAASSLDASFYVSPKKTPEDDDCVLFSDDEDGVFDPREVVTLQLPGLDAKDDGSNDFIDDEQCRDDLLPIVLSRGDGLVRLSSFVGESSITVRDIPKLYEAGILIKIDEQNTQIAACGHIFQTKALIQGLQYYSVCLRCNCSIFSEEKA